MARLAARCLSAKAPNRYNPTDGGTRVPDKRHKGPRLDPKDRTPVTKGDLEDVAPGWRRRRRTAKGARTASLPARSWAALPAGPQGLKRVADSSQ